MKKIVSLLLIFIFMIMTITSVGANDNINEGRVAGQTITCSELEGIEKLKNQSDQELINQGYTKNEIEEIRNLDPEKELLKRAQMDSNTLKNMGYSDKQIETFKKYRNKSNCITQEDITILASKMTVNTSHSGFTHSSANGTRAYVHFTWAWSSLPLFRLNDMVAFRWGKGFSSSTSASSLKVTYRNETTGLTDSKTFYIAGKEPNVGCHFKFPVNKLEYGGDAISGRATVLLTEPDKNISTFEVVGAYGHTSINIAPSVSYPLGGGISFRIGMTKYQDFHDVY